LDTDSEYNLESIMAGAFNILIVFKMMCAVQALAAASKTVDFLKVVHSLHAYFLLVGDFDSKYISVTLC